MRIFQENIDFKPISSYENAFCIIAGYGALCIQLSLRNLASFTSNWNKIFQIATLSFLILANIASVDVLVNGILPHDRYFYDWIYGNMD